jgi:bifunctional non-homologous end joining protein LigD
MTAAVVTNGRSVPITHPERVLFPDVGLTKLDLARYYDAVGDVMIAHVRERPLALESFPADITGERYYLKRVPSHFPSWIATAEVPRRGGGAIRQALANNGATLVYLAGQNAITLHVWTSRADRLERPDRLIFDLDPSSSSRFAEVRATARALGDLLRELGLAPYVMTTGSRGLHVVTPLRRTADHEQVLAFAGAVGERLVVHDPRRLTMEFHRKRRGGRLYVDIARNAYAQHAVAPYAVRGLPGAPVATPLRWEELDDRRLGPQRWSLRNLPARIAEVGDPWRDISRDARALGPAARALREATR